MRWTTVSMLLISLLIASPAFAQSGSAEPKGRPKGWWADVGGGFSALRFSCKDCGEEQPVYESGSVRFSVGKTLGKKVAMGVEVGAAFPKNAAGTRAVASSLSGVARWYPSGSPLFIKFGLGVARARVRAQVNGQSTDSIQNGVAVSFGAGYDIRLGSRMALTPIGGWYISAVGDIITPTRSIQNISWNTWSAGVALTIF